jgi:DNA-binding MarR family transcriptional regulator
LARPDQGIRGDSLPLVPSETPGDEVIARMGRAWREMRRGASTAVVRDRLFGVGPDAVEPGHMDVLDLLVQREHWRMSELAAALRVDPSTVTRTLQRMEAAGLAERRPPASGDRRAVVVTLTSTGRRRHAAVAERRVRIIGEIMAQLSADDCSRLVELLERFVAATDKYVAANTRPPAPSRVGR